MKSERPVVLSIAGFDPCAGAGILADIKVFEMHKVIGMGACTSLTYQNEEEFKGLSWMEGHAIEKQLELLFKKYKIDFVKIGLVQGLKELDSLIDFLLEKNSLIKIVWDPILKASAGFSFHEEIDQELLVSILKKIYLLVPNLYEMERLNPKSLNATISAKNLCRHCMILLKGGHSKTDTAEDILFIEDKSYSFSHDKIENGEKHGSGCVLSASMTAYMALGYDVIEACRKAKNYTAGFLASNKGLLGYHN
jgi:hydroxymethylpyrimidine/phosphomethylpyrimidine kinase